MCEQETISRTHVNNNMLDSDDLLKEVLNGSFNMLLPATFKKIVNTNPAYNAKQAVSRVDREGKGRDKKKRKNKNGNGNLVRRNTSQDNDF
jgi:hypothetical protein